MSHGHGGGGQVIVFISGEMEGGTSSTSSSKNQETLIQKQGNDGDLAHRVCGQATVTPPSCPSPPEISGYGSSPNKPPRLPKPKTLLQWNSLNRSAYLNPKSRFGEVPIDISLLEENSQTLLQELYDEYPAISPPSSNNSKGTAAARTIPVTPNTPQVASPRGGQGDDDDDDDEDEEVYRKVEKRKSEKHRKVQTKALLDWLALMFIMVCLMASLTVPKLKGFELWSLEIWKWCVLVMVIFSGMLFTNWFIHVLIFFIERNFLLRKKILYFVNGLKRSVKVFIWLGLILLTWTLLFHYDGVQRSKSAKLLRHCITWTLLSLLVGALLWLLKALMLKILESNFHVNTFFDRIQESIFHQYVLQTLSGPPIVELAEKLGRTQSTTQMRFTSTKGKEVGNKKRVIDMAKLHDMKQEKVSAWTMKLLIDVASSGLSTISNTLDGTLYGTERADKGITSEMEAVAAAYDVFRNVAQPGFKYIDEDDLLRFMYREEMERVLSSFEGLLEARQIDRKALAHWLVKIYKGRKALALALTDTRTAVKQLNKVVTGILVIVVILIWLLLMEIATTKVLVFLSSQLVVVAFMFGNTCKTIFEAIIFVFVTHPYDVGDRCVVDGVQMIVEEMNILTTVFLRYDNEKIYYPNSVLCTKAISNFYRSPDMGDFVDFTIDFVTPVEKIESLKDKIKRYLEKNPHHWYPNHDVIVKDILIANKLSMALYMTHTINFQDYGEKTRRRSELVIEMKKMFEELDIKYTLVPQEIHLSNVASATTIGHKAAVTTSYQGNH